MSTIPTPHGLTILSSDLNGPEARTLISALNAELSAEYPEPGATHFGLSADDVSPANGIFLVAAIAGKPVGCGALRRIQDPAFDGPVGELKRMYVSPERRGLGIGRALLSRLEDSARALGLATIVLETGPRQTKALVLYQRAGFTPIPPFGEYLGSPVSVCLAKPL